ncbi:peptidoglycan-binding lysin domain-containing protein [Thermincola ferriacetica]|uniref:Peptidoglycan-binding lysin domain-containing protein n=1 Tax=Thermincola ferriacetica TaxID=281456 RepID=A0A0L6W1D1_9FIRM|nr:LysM domain-containing protein [Thermincola ferriacetica]KNZ69193.1 peptidoglycan-binding lysin domain-containing protein [Thermincola ferriacetica]
MSQDKNRFIFFKYVPQKKKTKPVKKDTLDSLVEKKIPLDDEELQEQNPELNEPTNIEELLEPPVHESLDLPTDEEASKTEVFPDQNSAGEIAEEEEPKKEDSDAEAPDAEGEATGFPGWPGFPDFPEWPEEPECPELPEEPECPELPKEPECPEFPEFPEEPGPCPENSVIHIIRRGDTYWKLARKYNTTVEAIEAANPDVNPLNLQIGQTICIPLGIPGAKG